MYTEADLQSKDIAADKQAKLKALFPEVFTEGDKIDFDKLRLTLGDSVDTNDERFGLHWAGKKECFSIIQEPSIGTLKPAKDESVNWEDTENLFIEGDNLEVLKLLQKSYYGKVKMIYIDPPYNTGKEFIYPDSYKENIDTYLAYTEQVNDKGYKFSTNVETEGRFHSRWLNMMYPRLFLARNLLKEDGVVFISIDDNEAHNLKGICNEIFGEENFLAQIVWQRAYAPVNLKKTFSENHDYILCFAKDIEQVEIKGLKRDAAADKRYKNPDNDPRGAWKSSDLSVGPIIAHKVYEITTPSGRKVLPPSGYCWRLSKERFKEFVDDNRIWFGKDGSNVPSIKRFLSEVGDRITPLTLWKREEVGDSQEGRKELKKLFKDKAYFDYPKPVRLMKRLVELTTDDNDIIMDFFAGSSSMAHAVIDKNKEEDLSRKFIMVQLPEKIDEKSIAYKDGFKNIGQLSRERIIKAIDETKSNEGFKTFKLNKSNFKIWEGTVEYDVPKQIEFAINHINPDSSELDILYEILLKAGFELTLPIQELTLADKKVYSVEDDALLICLESELTEDVIRAIAAKEPARFVCLDTGFKNNDQLKTNTVQIMKSHNVHDFKTV